MTFCTPPGCYPQPQPPPPVVFDPVAFLAAYPKFSAVPTATLQQYFNQATLYLSNDGTSPITNVTTLTTLFFMLVAHIATLNGALTADGSNPPVGAINSAAEGSVSVGITTAQATPGSPIWFQQTQYGAAFWQATSNARGFFYRPRRTRY